MRHFARHFDFKLYTRFYKGRVSPVSRPNTTSLLTPRKTPQNDLFRSATCSFGGNFLARQTSRTLLTREPSARAWPRAVQYPGKVCAIFSRTIKQIGYEFTLLDRGDGMYGCTIEYAVGKNRSADTHFANGTSLYFSSIRDNVCANASSSPTPPPSRLRRNVDVLPCCMSSSVASLMPVYTEPPLAFASRPPSTLEALQGSNATFTWMTTIYVTPLADFDSVVFGLWQRGYVSVYLMTVTRDGTVIRNPNFHINTPWLGHRVTWEGNLSKKSLVFRIANCTLQDQATYGISVHLGPFKNSLTEPVYLRIKPDAKRGTLLVRNNSCNPYRNANTIILALLVSTIFAQLE